jgi:hypothetical protein
MQALMCDSCDGRTGSALGLTTTAQSVATVIAPNTTAALIAALGVGEAVAVNTVVPAVLALGVALFLRDLRPAEKAGGSQSQT